jgi:hypothetical protein
VAGIRHPELRTKLVCCGTDANTGNPAKSPRNLSELGVNTCKLIARNAGQIEMELGDEKSAFINTEGQIQNTLMITLKRKPMLLLAHF